MVSPTWRAEPTAGGFVGSLWGRDRERKTSESLLLVGRCVGSLITQTAAVSYGNYCISVGLIKSTVLLLLLVLFSSVKLTANAELIQRCVFIFESYEIYS